MVQIRESAWYRLAGSTSTIGVNQKTDNLIDQRRDPQDISVLSSQKQKAKYALNEMSRTIHLLGAGNVGNFIAHSFAGIPNPPSMVLLLRDHSRLRDWRRSKESIEVIRNGIHEVRKGFDVEVLTSKSIKQAQDESPSTPIHSLIVSVKAADTVAALSSVASRLTRDSTVLFMQNGMGVIDDVNRVIFPDVEERPNYMLGILSHGLYGEKPFTVVHAGLGTTAIGVLPRYRSNQIPLIEAKKHLLYPSTSRHLLRTLTRTAVLSAAGFAPTDLMQLQLEKLTANAIINPLTVLFDCDNGDLLHNLSFTRVMRLLLAEISLVIRSMPELKGVPNVRLRFSTARLEALVLGTARKTARNRSSMLQDVRAGKSTEIDYINGYIVRKGEEMGVRCIMNYMVQHMVKGKQNVKTKEVNQLLPFETLKSI